MYLAAIHPSSTEAEVQEATGWELTVADDVSETRTPTPEEIALIREDLDPDGIYTE